MKHGINLNTESAYDIHGVDKDVLDVLKMLGLGQAPTPRPTAVSYAPVSSRPQTPIRPSQPPPPPPPSMQPIPPPPMPRPGYKPTQRRRSIKSALAKAVVVALVLLIALAVVSQLADYLANTTVEVTNQQTASQRVSTMSQLPIVLTQVKWIQYINPTSGIDKGLGTCLFGNYLVVVGYASISPFLALLDKESGKVVKTWSRGSGWFVNCIAVGDKLYVVGNVEEEGEFYQIYAFDKNLNVLNRVHVALASFDDIVYQDGYLYVGGIRLGNVGGRYMIVQYIEKRALDLSIVTYREINYVNWDGSGILSIGINPATGDVWAVGHYVIDKVSGNIISSYWFPLVTIFDKDLNFKRFIQLPSDGGFFNNICFDDEGNAYVSGEANGSRITIKFDKNGNYIKKYDGGDGIICVKDKLYLFDHINDATASTRQLAYEIIDMKTMKKIGQVNLPVSGVGNLTGFYFSKPSFDGRYIYVAGVLGLGFSTNGKTLPTNDTKIVVFAVSVAP